MKELFGNIWTTYVDIAPYLMFGLTMAGLLHIFITKDLIAKHLGKNNLLSAVKASVLGVPLPLCSCGVIPTALYLRKQRASRGATLSFLISTPQTGVDSIIATYGMLGPVFALFRPIAAFVTGIVGGLSANFFFKKENSHEKLQDRGFSCDTCEVKVPHTHTFPERIWSGLSYAFKDFLDDISLQLLFGVILAGIISFAIPDNFFHEYGGDGILGMLFMILFGIPLYVCATASIPIAVSLIMKGISPGAAFVFLVVGPATNAATIALIANALGKKMVVIYLAVISIFAILGGYLLNFIFELTGTQKLMQIMHSHDEGSVMFTILVILFSIAMVFSLIRKLWGRINARKDNAVMKENYDLIMQVEGMTCNHCVMNVEKAIRNVAGVTDVRVDLKSGTAGISGDFSRDEVIKAVEDAGYKAG